MALKSELMTYLGYEPGTKGMKFMRSSNMIFMASTTTFDEALFPCCPTATMPTGTVMDDDPPHDQEGSHGPPDDKNHSQGPSSPNPSSPTDSFKDELKDSLSDFYGSDVASNHGAQDTAAHDPPSSTPPVLSREPSIPRMPIRQEHMVPNQGDCDEWDRLPRRSGRSRNIPLCPGNVYSKQRLPSDIEQDLIRDWYWKKTIGDNSKSHPSVNIPQSPQSPEILPPANIPKEIPM